MEPKITKCPTVKRKEFSRPRSLTQSEIDSLRQDAISTGMEMEHLLLKENRNAKYYKKEIS